LTHGPAGLKLEGPQQGRTGADGRPLPAAAQTHPGARDFRAYGV